MEAAFAHLITPGDRRERQRWFPLAGRVPEGLLGQAGRLIPWRTLVEFPAGAGGEVVALAASAPGLLRWDPRRLRLHLRHLLLDLAERGTRVVGLGAGLAGTPGGAEALAEVAGKVWPGGETTLVRGWAGRLAGCLGGSAWLAAERAWDCERTEVLVVGGETSAGRVGARLLARRFGRLALAGEGLALDRLAEQILHETGTAVKVGVPWGRALVRADRVALAGPLPEGAEACLRPDAVTLSLCPGLGAGPARCGGEVLFAWPGATPATRVPGVVWPAGSVRAATLVSSELAVAAALGATAVPGGDDAAGEEARQLAAEGEPTLGGVDALWGAMARSGFKVGAVLDKGGADLV
jgi:hypothetical protein